MGKSLHALHTCGISNLGIISFYAAQKLLGWMGAMYLPRSIFISGVFDLMSRQLHRSSPGEAERGS